MLKSKETEIRSHLPSQSVFHVDMIETSIHPYEQAGVNKQCPFTPSYL